MAYFYYEGMVPLTPELEKIKLISDDDESCCFKVPEIYYEGTSDSCEEESAYDWFEDSVLMVKNQYIVRFSESTFNEVLLKTLDGSREWVSGKVANIVGIDVDEHEGIRMTREYFVEIYDLEKNVKKKGKVVFEEPSPMDGYELWLLKQHGGAVAWNSRIEVDGTGNMETVSKESFVITDEEFRELEETYSAGSC